MLQYAGAVLAVLFVCLCYCCKVDLLRLALPHLCCRFHTHGPCRNDELTAVDSGCLWVAVVVHGVAAPLCKLAFEFTLFIRKDADEVRVAPRAFAGVVWQ